MLIEPTILQIPAAETMRQSVTARRGRSLIGCWAVAPSHVAEAMTWFCEEPAQPASRDGLSEIAVLNNVALVDIRGVMSKRGHWYDGSGSTIALRTELQSLAHMAEIDTVVLRIESPGGTSSGTAELADQVFELRRHKRVVAFIEDIGASAAYWVASQADKIVANESALIGSIGAYVLIPDYSGYFDNFGIKVHMISSGPLKGGGAIGSEIKDRHLEHWQHLIDQMHNQFVAAVSRGRQMSAEAVKELADGRLMTAAESKAARLIDNVQSLDSLLGELVTKKKGKQMANTEHPPHQAADSSQTDAAESAQHQRPATAAELRQAMPHADAAFLLGQLEAGATLVAALTAFAATVPPQRTGSTGGNQVVQGQPRTTEPSITTSLLAEVDKRSRAIMAGQHELRPFVARIQALRAIRHEMPELLGTSTDT